MPYELPTDQRTERRARVGRWVGFTFAAILIALIAYLGYVGYVGSEQLTNAPTRSADCRTPATLGWSYEAINYDIGADAVVEEQADPTNCTGVGARPPGDALIASDGIRLAGWYIPAEAGIGPTGATVVLAHGWGSNRSTLLDRAAVLHDDYNVVLFDLRNHGQSLGSQTTQGVLEQLDLRAAIDWLEREKGPEAIAVLGVSMGGATAANEVEGDPRVDALILESTHATIANATQARLDKAGYPLSLPASWAILLGGLVRTGLDISAADPIQSVASIGDRPLLLISAGADDTLGETDAFDMLAAAEGAAVTVTLEVCDGAGHAASPTVCAEDYRA
ncbi:MAG: alpha/beta hydrolase, partial [Candidatus Limnocylindria bacterium]